MKGFKIFLFLTKDPNDIVDDPLFTDRANDDYTLTGSSPGSGTASDSGDKGAWVAATPLTGNIDAAKSRYE